MGKLVRKRTEGQVPSALEDIIDGIYFFLPYMHVHGCGSPVVLLGVLLDCTSILFIKSGFLFLLKLTQLVLGIPHLCLSY